MNYFKIILILIFSSFALATQIHANQNERISARVNRDQVNLGDALIYSVEVVTAGARSTMPVITLPELSQMFQSRDIFSRSTVNILNGKTYITNIKEAYLTAKRTGRITIPPSRVDFINTATRERSVRYTQPVNLMVNQAGGAPAVPTPAPEIDMLRPIKTSARISAGQWLPMAIGVLMIFAVLGLGAYMRGKPVAPPPEPDMPKDTRTPEQKALEALEQIKDMQVTGKIKVFYTALSDILRRFLAESYAFKAEESTTRELLEKMEDLGFQPVFLDQYRKYWQECDRVKFANFLPELPKLKQAYAQARQLIQHPQKRVDQALGTDSGAAAGRNIDNQHKVSSISGTS